MIKRNVHGVSSLMRKIIEDIVTHFHGGKYDLSERGDRGSSHGARAAVVSRCGYNTVPAQLASHNEENMRAYCPFTEKPL